MSKPTFQAPRGTRDFYPEDYRRREWLFNHFRSVAKRFGFEEVDAPLLEHADLFIRKAGEEIVDQLYHFTLHDRHLALRAELTPSLSRMLIARAGSLRLPVRWFAVGQNWRYERMTKGRRREHYQWDMEIFGEPGISAEAELIAAAFQLIDDLGLDAGDVRMSLNSRALLEATLQAEILRDRPGVFEPLCVIIDKLDKIGADAVVSQLTDSAGPVGLDEKSARALIDMLSAKSLDEAEARLPATARNSPALAELRLLFELLEAYGIADRVVFDASVVRGLAYYTGVVFEAFDSEKALRSICGGGRYDRLLEKLGGPSIPAVGFGFGDTTIAELLKSRGRLPELTRDLDDLVYAFSDTERPAAIRVARHLRAQGRRVELVLGSPKLRRAMSDADRSGAARIWLLGPDEVARGVAKVKDLASGDEREEPLADGAA